MDHVITERTSPITVQVRCSCGWSVSISRRQNALARAAKVRAAIRKHLNSVPAGATKGEDNGSGS